MGITGVLMITVNWCVIIMWCCSHSIQARSVQELEKQEYRDQTRACGDHLADVLALVCKDRGYNVYFSSDDSYTNERRHKRGIVEECCHNGCSYHTLEQYCKPISTEMPDNSQIRKRSDNDKSWEVPVNDKFTKNLYFRHRSYENNEQIINFGNKKGLFSRLIGGRNIDNTEENSRNRKNDYEVDSFNRRLDNKLDHETNPSSKESSRRNDNRTQQDDQPKQDHINRSSRVGYVDPYFMNKELVHPHVKASVDFTVNNLRQPLQ